MGKLKAFFIIFIVAAAIAAAGIFFFEKSPFGSKSEIEKGSSAEELAELSIDTDVITTNLASQGNFGIVQFNILLSSEKSKLEAEKRTPEIRAAIISTIAGFTIDELIGTEGITELEEEMNLKLGKIVETGKVERVLVTELKVQ
ncbi:flagellar basal body-associated FliL family protein [Paenisporosarcina indica]|uniref:flagellar basal body-associated FliL family protein n=1 Tax=Paenisporosarcina indica TaxID=650093 RepID=UPI00094FA085|nr:flagellar basal body-associated FliL family protein [Paenisporosarcina indica]